MDTDHDGRIGNYINLYSIYERIHLWNLLFYFEDYGEFEHFTIRINSHITKSEMKNLFFQIDKDHSGYITLEGIYKIFHFNIFFNLNF